MFVKASECEILSEPEDHRTDEGTLPGVMGRAETDGHGSRRLSELSL